MQFKVPKAVTRSYACARCAGGQLHPAAKVGKCAGCGQLVKTLVIA